jgi:uncharacterized protein (DUF2141 family)
MRVTILFFILFTSGVQLLFGQYKLEVHIKGVHSPKGAIAIAIYTDEKEFLNIENAYRYNSIPAMEKHSYVFANLKEGTYAVAAFYDENSNDQLDTNIIGIPKEALGTSGNPKNKFGPPKFKNCKFYLNSNQMIEIELKKFFDN